MELTEFLDCKQNLEIEIMKSIYKKIQKFRDATGTSPYSIDIKMVNVTEFGDKMRNYEISNVKCSFKVID